MFFRILIPWSLYDAKTYWCKEMKIFQSYSHWRYKVHLNKVMVFIYNTYIISEYFHLPWNLEGYYIALPKPKSNTIPTPYCDNILNHGTNDNIAITHQNIIEIPLYHQCGQYCNTFMYIYQQFCIGPLNNFYHLWVWKYFSVIFNV
jgi:hypothetical protein